MRRGLFIGAIGAMAAGLYLVIRWLIDTDIMFGHYTAPMHLVYAGLGLILVGVACGGAWFIGALRGRAERVANGKPSRRGILAGGCLVAVMLPAGVVLYFASAAAIGTMTREPKPPPIPAEELAEQLRTSTDFDERAAAARKLGGLGTGAAFAEPDLRNALDDPNGVVRVLAAEAHWRVTGESEPAVTTMLDIFRDPETTERTFSAVLYPFLRFKDVAPDAVPILEEAAREHPHPYGRAIAAIAYWNFTVDPGRALPLFQHVLEAEALSTEGYTLTLQSLAQLGEHAAPAIPTVEDLATNHPDQTVRREAALVLKRIRDAIAVSTP